MAEQFEHQYTQALLNHVARGDKTIEDLKEQSERKSQFAENPEEYLASTCEVLTILQSTQQQ